MLLIFGSINIDFVFPVSSLAKAGDTIWSTDARTEPGGKGANAAVAAAQDGAAVTLVGAVGNDVLADAALAGLTRAGVTLRHIVRAPMDTGRAAVCVDRDGYNALTVYPGANFAARAAQVPDSLLGPGCTVLVQMETDPAETAAVIHRAKRRGCTVIMHLSPSRPIETSALTAVDLLLGNQGELAWAGEHLGTGNNPASVSAALGIPVIRMQGVQGAQSHSPAGFRLMPVYPVHMRDTTGAADCFAGVLAAAIDRGKSLEAAMRRASVAAALSTTGIGAQRSMPKRRDIEAALSHAPDVTDKQPELPD